MQRHSFFRATTLSSVQTVDQKVLEKYIFQSEIPSTCSLPSDLNDSTTINRILCILPHDFNSHASMYLLTKKMILLENLIFTTGKSYLCNNNDYIVFHFKNIP